VKIISIQGSSTSAQEVGSGVGVGVGSGVAAAQPLSRTARMMLLSIRVLIYLLLEWELTVILILSDKPIVDALTANKSYKRKKKQWSRGWQSSLNWRPN
jgi:hypothetical protein